MNLSLRSFLARILLAPVLISAATLQVHAAPTVDLGFGYTSVKFSPGFLEAATSLGVGIKRVSPGFVSTFRREVTAYFPIDVAALDLGTLKGEIIHSGGLKLTAGNTVVELTNYIIDTTGATPVLTGLVTLNDSVVTRAPLFDLALPALTPPLTLPKSRRVHIGDVSVTLTQAAADLLNSVFGVTAFAGGLEIGTATVTARAH